MSRTHLRRIARLEAAQPQFVGKWHQIVVDEGEDAEAQMAAMFATGEAKEGDQFIVCVIVTPPAWEPAR
jgi:predicted phosphoribosyltransferase